MLQSTPMNYKETLENFFKVLDAQYPKNSKGKHYMTLSNGRKCFFNIFIKKYGLDGSDNKYSKQDVMRRIRFIEVIDLIAKQNKVIFDRISNNKHKIYVIESLFFKIIIIDIQKHHASQMELLSFIPK